MPGAAAWASSGTATLGRPSSVSATTRRFGTHPLPWGEGKNAGSPSASQTSRLAGSLMKPATGFHADWGRVGMPTVSQPFQGKSLSFTVRGKIAESRPAWASWATFSTPPEYSTLSGSVRSVYPATTRSQLAPSADTRRRSRVSRSATTLDRRPG